MRLNGDAAAVNARINSDTNSEPVTRSPVGSPKRVVIMSHHIATNCGFVTASLARLRVPSSTAS